MNRLTAIILLRCALCLLIPSVGASSTLINGGLQNTGTWGPETIVLNLASVAMNSTMIQANNYFIKNGKLAPANKFFRKPKPPSPIDFITNDAKGAVILVFSQNVPGGLKGKKIRCVIPSPANFTSQICITDIDQNNNGQPFFLNPIKNFTPSITVLGTNFGTVYTAPSSNVTNMNYNSIQKNVRGASNNTNQSLGSTSATSNIATV